MVEEITSELILNIISAYKGFLATLPSWAQNFTNLFLLVILIVAYSMLIWKFYRFIARKDILRLNLGKYKKSSHSIFEKILAMFLYLIEYIIIIPFIIFFGFSVLTFFLILLTEGVDVGTILIISSIVISAVRMTAYYKEDLSRDLAKLLPLNLLAIAMLTQGIFNFERIIGNFSQLPVFFDAVLIYLLFIVILEILLRFFDFIFSLFGFEKEGEEKEV